jgi:hypothetical protein
VSRARDKFFEGNRPKRGQNQGVKGQIQDIINKLIIFSFLCYNPKGAWPKRHIFKDRAEELQPVAAAQDNRRISDT